MNSTKEIPRSLLRGYSFDLPLEKLAQIVAKKTRHDLSQNFTPPLMQVNLVPTAHLSIQSGSK
jgi:hypothetical protein